MDRPCKDYTASRKISKAILVEDVSKRASEKTTPTIISSLGDKSVRVIQDFYTA